MSKKKGADCLSRGKTDAWDSKKKSSLSHPCFSLNLPCMKEKLSIGCDTALRGVQKSGGFQLT